jgi:hypothetical protein
MTHKRFPLIPLDLLEELERRFPDRMPDALDTNELLRRQGNIQVVRLLRMQYDQQDKSILRS